MCYYLIHMGHMIRWLNDVYKDKHSLDFGKTTLCTIFDNVEIYLRSIYLHPCIYILPNYIGSISLVRRLAHTVLNLL